MSPGREAYPWGSKLRRRATSNASSRSDSARNHKRGRGAASGLQHVWKRYACFVAFGLVAVYAVATWISTAIANEQRCWAPAVPTGTFSRLRNLLTASPDAFSNNLCRPPPVWMLSGGLRRPPRIALALAVSTRAFMRHSEPTAYELSNVVLRKSVALELPPGFEERLRSGAPLAPERRRSIRLRPRRAAALSAARRRVKRMPLFRTLLPSFIRTASRGYAYTFVVVLDRDDPLVEELGGAKDGVQRFLRVHFDAAVARARWDGGGAHESANAPPAPLPRLVVRLAPRNAEGGEPARRQGEAVIHAYVNEGADYVLRLNDDTQLLTAYWAELLISALQQQGNIGVVGPTCLDGNQDIMTHEMTHLTHLSGAAEAAMRAQLAANRERLAYYPPNFTAWYADEWIDRVYRPVGLSRRLASVRVAHQWHPQQAQGGESDGSGVGAGGEESRVWSAVRDVLRGREYHKPKSRYYGAPADADLLRRVLPAGWRTVQRALRFKRSCRRVVAMAISPALPPPERIAAAKAVADSALVVAKLMPGWTLRVYVRIGSASDLV